MSNDLPKTRRGREDRQAITVRTLLQLVLGTQGVSPTHRQLPCLGGMLCPGRRPWSMWSQFPVFIADPPQDLRVTVSQANRTGRKDGQRKADIGWGMGGRHLGGGWEVGIWWGMGGGHLGGRRASGGEWEAGIWWGMGGIPVDGQPGDSTFCPSQCGRSSAMAPPSQSWRARACV